MEARSFEGKRTFKEKAYKDAIVEEDVDDDFDEEEGGGEMMSFADNDRKRAGAVFSGKRGTSGGAGGVSPPCCQAEKCGADLSDAKRYHRRHKVCELHSKASVVIVAGQRQRFCQQCSRSRISKPSFSMVFYSSFFSIVVLARPLLLFT